MKADEPFVYFPIRVCVASYIWLTGFGNYVYFHERKDFSLTRVVKMLLRINLFVIFFCYAAKTKIAFYYIAPLHSFYFLMVYAVMGIGYQKNYQNCVTLLKLLLTFALLFIIMMPLMSPYRLHLD